MWLAAALLVAALGAPAADSSRSGHGVFTAVKSSKSQGSSNLIKTLRKQLMRDNSDYSHEIPKHTGAVHMRADPDLHELQGKNIDNNYYVTKINQQRDNEENSKIKDTAEENGRKQKPEHPVSQKDLFYYIDDEKLIRKKPGDTKYKTIKVRHQYRRNGKRQYIQEEGEEGVAIVSLSRAPFPDLRLPHSRRQYQHDHGAASTDDDHLPPPPVDDKPVGEHIAVQAAAAEDATVTESQQADKSHNKRAQCTDRSQGPVGNATSGRVDLADVLRHDLRRHNDDYAETEPNKTNSSASSFTATTSDHLLKYAKQIIMEHTKNIISEFNRRAGGGNSWEFDYNEVKTVPSTVIKKTDSPVKTVTKEPLRKRKSKKNTINNLNHPKRNTSKLTIPGEIKLPKINSTTMPVKSIPQLSEVTISKKKIDRFKKFIGKNKELFKGLNNLNSKPETRTRRTVELKTPTNKVKLDDNILREMRNKVREAGRAGEDQEQNDPDPDVLDMAPAKGGRIHRLRAKGRLCHRHVLLPEGPKYDSSGRWYVPEHRAAARREYDATRRPRLLLPRCCNCCKKSVLGCQ